MRLDILKERITNAQLKLEKKTAAVEKKTKLIEKKKDRLEKLGLMNSNTSEADWIAWDIKHLEDDVKTLNREVEEIKKSLARYQDQQLDVAKEEERIKEFPDVLKKMQSELVERWDNFDIERRDQLKREYKEMSYSEFRKKYKTVRIDDLYTTDEQIHNKNMRDAKRLILDLLNRVEKITGEVTDWSNIHSTVGAQGFSVLNGYVQGKMGRAKIETILAGGYAIQRLHVRTLVKEYN